MRFKFNWATTATLGLGLLLAPAAVAAPVFGSLPFTGIGVDHGVPILPGNLDDPNSLITATGSLTTNSGLGDYSPIPTGTSFGAFSVDVSTLATGGGFSITNASWGTFVATSGVIIPPNTASFLNISFTGTFTPGPSLLAINAGYSVTPTSVNFGVTESGGSHSASFTLQTIPEPGSLSLLAMGLGMLGFAYRRKIRHKA